MARRGAGARHQQMRGHRAQPHGADRDPGRQGKDRAAGHARAHGTAARQHRPEPHQRGAHEVAFHRRVGAEALDPPVARDERHARRADEHARHQPDAEAEGQRGAVHQPHQRVGRRAGEGHRGDADDLERRLRDRSRSRTTPAPRRARPRCPRRPGSSARGGSGQAPAPRRGPAAARPLRPARTGPAARADPARHPRGRATAPRDASRAGDRTPRSADCATMVSTSPVTSARRLPVAESTSRRLAQPRARIIPAPNISPPMIAPERLPVAASWGACETSRNPRRSPPAPTGRWRRRR